MQHMQLQQECLTVASIARDDPSIGGGHICWGSYDGFNFAGWCSRCVPGMHRDPCTSVTDRRTLTS